MNFENASSSRFCSLMVRTTQSPAKEFFSKNLRLLFAARRMLTDVKPHLKNVTYGDALPSDNAAKNAFSISGNAYVDIRLSVLAFPESPRSFKTSAFKRSR